MTDKQQEYQDRYDKLDYEQQADFDAISKKIIFAVKARRSGNRGFGPESAKELIFTLANYLEDEL